MCCKFLWCMVTSGGFRGGAWPWALRFSCPKRTSHPPPPQCICQNVPKYTVRCLKVVPGVPKMVLIRSKSKKYPPISSKAACKICPKVIPDGPKMAWIGSKSKHFQRPPPQPPDPQLFSTFTRMAPHIKNGPGPQNLKTATGGNRSGLFQKVLKGWIIICVNYSQCSFVNSINLFVNISVIAHPYKRAIAKLWGNKSVHNNLFLPATHKKRTVALGHVTSDSLVYIIYQHDIQSSVYYQNTLLIFSDFHYWRCNSLE